VATCIHLDHFPPLIRNGLHCIRFLNNMEKILLNLILIEPLFLVKKMPFLDNSLELHVLLVSGLYFCVHDMVDCILFSLVMVYLSNFQVLYHM
jgi:hypothetical protein